MAGRGPINLPAAPAAFAPSAGTQIGQALGNFPQMMQAAQLQQAQMMEQKSQIGQQLYDQIGKSLSSDPRLVSDPALISRVMQISKMTGLPAPLMDKDGTKILDKDALVPRPDFSQVPLHEKLQGLQLPPEQRKAMFSGYRDVDPSYLSQEQYVPLGATSVAKLSESVSKDIDAVSAGKLDPTRFAADIKSKYSILKHMGLNPDELLSPEFMQSSISQYAQNEINKTKAIVGHLANEDKIRALIEKDKKSQFQQQLGLGYYKVNTQAQLSQQRQGIAAAQLQLSARRLSDYERNLDSLMQNRQMRSSVSNLGIIRQAYNDLQKQYDFVENQKSAAVRAAQAAVNSGASDIIPELKDQLDPESDSSLTAQMDSVGGKLDAYGTLLKQAQEQAMASAMGVPVQVIRTTIRPPTGHARVSGGPSGGPLDIPQGDRSAKLGWLKKQPAGALVKFPSGEVRRKNTEGNWDMVNQ